MSSTVTPGSGSPGNGNPAPSVDFTWMPAVEFKLADHYERPDPPEQLSLASLLPAGHSLIGVVSALKAESLYVKTTSADLQSIVQRARELDPNYRPPRFANLIRVRTPDVQVAQLLAEALRAQVSTIDFAEVQRVGPLPGTITPVSDPLSALQIQHDAPRRGINSRAAWARNVDGSGVKLIDLERGYDRHEDLPDPIELAYGDSDHVSDELPEHGTAVLGIVAGIDNGSGGIGIAPGVELGFAKRYGATPLDDHLADAVAQCILKLQYGDVLLIDDQHFILDSSGAKVAVPIEAHPVMAMYLTTLKSLGIVLVEPAGYGYRSIDADCPPNSGAIMVGGINPTTFKRETVEHLSNFGTRVDCHACYSGIVTSGWSANQPAYGTFLGSGPPHSLTAYTNSFHGTSATSAIVAGAACLVQSYCVTNLGFRLGPPSLRSYLRTNGMPSADPANDLVGIMPNVDDCIARLGFRWPIIIRSKPDDHGIIPRPPIGESPDLVVRLTPGPDPGPFLGLSDAFDEMALSSLHFNGVFIFVRARATTSPVENVVARLYASPPSFQPRKWQRVGSAWIGSVPMDGELHGNHEPVLWDPSPIQEWGGCSLIAVLEGNRLPSINPRGIRNAVEMGRFYRNNEIVGVLTRLLPLHETPPTTLGWFRAFGFTVSNAPGPNHMVVLELSHTLPASVSISLKLPIDIPGHPAGSPITIEPGPEPTRVTFGLLPPQVVRCRLEARGHESTPPYGRFTITQIDPEGALGTMQGAIGIP